MSDLSQKIYQLRKQHNLTLKQVADVVGVGKSTVRKWETGMIANMRRDKIILIAEALHTTPAYLMGWEEAPSTPAGGDLKLSEGERELLALFRAVPKEHQRSVIELVRVHVNSISAARMGDR